MDRSKKVNQHEEMGKQLARKFNGVNNFKASGVTPVHRLPQAGNKIWLNGQGDSCDEVEAHEPRTVQLNFKASLMGVQIYDDDDYYFSRQSSMSSMFSDKFRPGVTIPCRTEEQGQFIEPFERRSEISIMASSIMSHAGIRAQSGSHSGENGSRLYRDSTTSHFEGSKAASGMLYPSPHVGSGGNSSILNAVHFSFSDASTSGSSRVTDKIYKQLLGQSRLQKCTDGGGAETMHKSPLNNHQTQSSSAVGAKMGKRSPVSTLGPLVSCSASLTFSERLFGYEFSRDSPQRQRDAKPAQLGQNVWQQNSQLGQYSMSIPALSDCDDTDEDDIIMDDDIVFEIPSEIALHCPHEQGHHAELVMVRAKPRPPSERWSSNRKSYHLDLDQIPVKNKAISVIGSRQHRSADPGRSVQARAKVDVSRRDITMSSLNSSFDGGSRRLKTRTLSFGSERSGWLEFESDSDDFVLDSGRLKLDISFEPDLDEPELIQVNNGLNEFQDARAKMDEEEFPFNSPIASSFVFGDGGNKRSEDAQQQILTTCVSSMPVSVAPGMEFDNEDLDHSDAYHDPDDGSISDTDSSLTAFSFEGDRIGLFDQPPLWVSTRSFNYVREVVDHNSGFLDIESRSGRFSVDLRREKRLDKAYYPPRPDMRLSIMKTEKTSSKRSLLSPCLGLSSVLRERSLWVYILQPFLHKQRNISRLHQPSLAASRRISFTTRLGPIAEAAPKLQSYNCFTARLGHAAADSTSRLQAINSFTARLGQPAETAPELQSC